MDTYSQSDCTDYKITVVFLYFELITRMWMNSIILCGLFEMDSFGYLRFKIKSGSN